MTTKRSPSIVCNDEAVELPWRPGYRNFVVAGKDQGVQVSASLGILEPGAGAPLHYHLEVDEVLLVLEGALDVTLGDETFRVEANHTISVPARVPHAFTAVGPGPARIIGFLPRQGAYVAAQYIGGDPPISVAVK